MDEQHPQTSAGARVLIIDDEPSVADALKLILDDSGYLARVAATGRAGLELARSESFALVITDLRLPDMCGLDVLAELRRQAPRRPVIIITAHSSDDVLFEAGKRGAFDLLSKPFLPSEILRRVSDALKETH